MGRAEVQARNQTRRIRSITWFGYTGKFILWQHSLPKSLAGSPPQLLAATSGLDGHQFAREHSQKDHGPLPDGSYEFVATIDPEQNSVEAANRLGDKSLSNPRQGIQFLRIGGNGPVDPNWGTMRVRLTPTSGNMFKRDGFYLHNSHKGFSHGCIEVGSTADGADFFYSLLVRASELRSGSKLSLLSNTPIRNRARLEEQSDSSFA